MEWGARQCSLGNCGSHILQDGRAQQELLVLLLPPKYCLLNNLPAANPACCAPSWPPRPPLLQGIEVLTQAVEACKASIEAAKGRMVVKEAARAVSEKEERALEEELQVRCGGAGRWWCWCWCWSVRS